MIDPEIGQPGLVDPFIAGQIAKRSALCPSEAEPPPVLVEPAPEQARDIVDEKPKTAIEIQHAPRDRSASL